MTASGSALKVPTDGSQDGAESRRLQRTVELFSGIGGFRIAAEGRGFSTVWANDNDARACQVYRERFGSEVLVEGDIREVWQEVPSHQLLTAGFPCQPFSSAGKKDGVRDPRGTLFREIVNVLDKRKPEFFILENVKRILSMEQGVHFASVLQALSELEYNIEWRLVNAMDLGLPQNRQRVVILGHRTEDQCLRIHLADDRELAQVLLRDYDVLQDRRSWQKLSQHRKRFPGWGLASGGRFYAAHLDGFSGAQPVKRLKEVLEPVVDDTFDFTEETVARLHHNISVDSFIQGVQILSNQNGGARMGYTIFGIEGVAPTLTSSTSRHYERYLIGDKYRRLTNVEYARIQGFPDDHAAAIPVYHQYALYGNAVPPEMAGWAMDRLSTGWQVNQRPAESQLTMMDLVAAE